jgi:hypothetical protein
MTIYAHAFWAWFPFRRRTWVKWLTLGAVLPDLPYCIVFGMSAVERGPRAIADMRVWESLWRSWPVCALHSFVPWAVVSLLYLSALRWMSTRGSRRARGGVRPTPFASNLAALLAGWGSHIVVDMLTHRSDGYPIFWPLTDYRFPTPVSYWEPAYHGRLFAVVCDGAMVTVLSWLIWQRFRATRQSRLFTEEPRT